MATNVSFNGSTYSVPADGDSNWGSGVSSYLIAIASGCLQKSGGTFTLTAEANFGATYGLKTAYIKSQATNPSSAGVIRLGNAENVSWRNNANNADIYLTVNASDQLSFNGDVIVAGLVVNADVDAAAAIALSKLAATTASRALVSDASGFISASSVTSTELGYVSGVTSAIQTQLNAKEASGTTATHAALTTTHGVSGTLVGTSDAQTLSNKTFSDAVQIAEIATPSTPSSGYFKVYPKSDGKLYTLNDSGTETEVGAGGASGINYVSNPSAESDTSGWSTYADAAGTSPVDGTGGSTNITWTRSTSFPLRGTANFLLTKDAANRQGEGISYDFTIASADKGKVLQASFEYGIGSGTFADNDVTIWVYDVTNAVLIQPAPYQLKNHSLSAEKFAVEFQTSTSSTSYRLIIHVGSTSASAYTLKFDNFSVGPQAKLYGSPVTDVQSWTPTISLGAGTISASVLTGKYARVGDSIVGTIKYDYSSGTGAAANFQLTLPSGLTPDTSKMNTNDAVGSGHYFSTAGGFKSMDVRVTGTSIFFTKDSASSFLQGTDMDEAGAALAATFRIPIQGWSSSAIMSSDADTRVVSFDGSGATSSAVGSNTTVKYSSIENDTHAGWNATNGDWTVSVPGYYEIIAQHAITSGGSPTVNQYNGCIIQIDPGTGSFATKRNDVAYVQNTGVQTYFARVVYKAYLYAGYKIRHLADTNITSPSLSTSTSNTFMSIKRLSGPSQIMASESVSAVYTGAPPTGSLSGVYNKVTFGTKVKDSHNAYSSGTWTCPVSGCYDISATIAVNYASVAAGTYTICAIYKNGSAIARGVLRAEITANTDWYPAISIKGYPVLAGDTIEVYSFANGTTPAFISSATENFFSISKSGNY